ncbi:MAG TPA: LLM class flavin-dependent oxidoreductase [Candidatus Binataceae bacterium]|nr:LLM class flavin-dependent oxidoreductase [Candidatus Binataceae bacterium]
MLRSVKFGYMLDFRNPPELSKIGDAEFYAAMMAQVDYADQNGLDSVWLTEHHFTDDGYLAAVTPALAAIAARTKRVTIGTYVLLVPFYHPLRLAEDSALIDVISNGRLRLGLGLAYRDEEFNGFQISRKERLGRTLETIEILKRAWTGERFSFAGKYFKFDDVRILPKPVSLPHPELLWGGMAPEAIRRGAKLGLSFACNLGKREVAMYRDALVANGRNPDDFNVVSNRIVYIADSAEQAWKDIEPAAMYQSRLYAKWLSAVGTAAPNPPDATILRRNSVIGTPAEVADRLAEAIESTPMTELCVAMQLPGLEPRKAMRSLERFATEVLPKLRK